MNFKFNHSLIFAFLISANMSIVEAADDSFLIGAGLHVGQKKLNPYDALQLLNSAGLSSFRDEVYWSRVQKPNGDFYIGPDAVDVTILIKDGFVKNGIRAIVPLGYGNKAFTGLRLPNTKDEIAAYAKYCEFFAQTYKSSQPLYEIWNEWNTGAGAQPPFRKKGDVGKYIELSRECAKKIRGVDPSATIVGGAVAGFDEEWVYEYARQGGLDFVNGLSLHPYVFHRNKTNAEYSWEWVDRVYKKALELSGKKSIPVYITEIGWPTHLKKGGVSEEKSAAELMKFLVIALSKEYVRGVWVYEMVDGGDDDADAESRFGLVKKNLKVYKPGFGALSKFSMLLKTLDGNRFAPHQSFEDVYMTKDRDGKAVVAFWSNSKLAKFLERNPKLKISSIYDYTGRPIARERAEVECGPAAPCYLLER